MLRQPRRPDPHHGDRSRRALRRARRGQPRPSGGSPQASAVGSAIDYAVGVLGVSKIVVCGHSGCGAIEAIVARQPLPETLKNLEAWLAAAHVRDFLRTLPNSLDLDEVGKLSVLSQIDHLRTYRVVADKLRTGEVSLAAWFFDVAKGEIEEWTDDVKGFVPVGEAGGAPVSARAR